MNFLLKVDLRAAAARGKGAWETVIRWRGERKAAGEIRQGASERLQNGGEVAAREGSGGGRFGRAEKRDGKDAEWLYRRKKHGVAPENRAQRREG